MTTDRGRKLYADGRGLAARQNQAERAGWILAQHEATELRKHLKRFPEPDIEPEWWQQEMAS